MDLVLSLVREQISRGKLPVSVDNLPNLAFVRFLMFLVNKGHYLAPKTTQIFISCAIEAAWCTGSVKNCLKAKGPFPGGQPIPVWLVHASLCDFEIPKLKIFWTFDYAGALAVAFGVYKPKDGLVWPLNLVPNEVQSPALVSLSLCDWSTYPCVTRTPLLFQVL